MRGSIKSEPFGKPAETKVEPPTFKSGGNLPAIEDSVDESREPNKENGGFPALNGMK